MKVECIKITDPETGSFIEKNSWLTVGNVYQVLSVLIADSSSVEYRLLSDDGYTPGIYEASQFKILSNKLALSWVCNYEDGVYFELAPKPWIRSGFWEDYFDGEPEAINIFNLEKKKIFQEEL